MQSHQIEMQCTYSACTVSQMGLQGLLCSTFHAQERRSLITPISRAPFINIHTMTDGAQIGTSLVVANAAKVAPEFSVIHMHASTKPPRCAPVKHWNIS